MCSVKNLCLCLKLFSFWIQKWICFLILFLFFFHWGSFVPVFLGHVRCSFFSVPVFFFCPRLFFGHKERFAFFAWWKHMARLSRSFFFVFGLFFWIHTFNFKMWYRHWEFFCVRVLFFFNWPATLGINNFNPRTLILFRGFHEIGR